MNDSHKNLAAFVETLPVHAQFFLNAAAGVLIYLPGESVGASVGKAIYNLIH